MKRTTIACSVSTDIGMPQDVLFALLNDDDRFFDLRPGAIEHRDIETLPGGGHACTQVYEVGGRTIAFRCRTTEFDPPLRFVDEVEAPDHRAKVTTSLAPMGTVTRLTIEQEATLSTAVGVIRRYAIRADAKRRFAAARRRGRIAAALR